MTDAHGSGEKKAVNAIAVAGFIGIVIAGMLLAVYASRYVPQLLNSLSSAVYLSADAPKNATTTPAKPTTQTPVVTPEPTNNPAPVATTTYQTPVTTGTNPSTYTPPRTTTTVTRPNLYGLPDLAVTNVQRSVSGDTMRLTFTVRNNGTNIVSGWLVRVRIEGQQDAIAQGGYLTPGGYQNFTLRATDIDRGSLDVDIKADYQNFIAESNENNNDYSTSISGGSSSRNDDVSCSIDASDTRVDEGDRITLEWDTDGDVDYASINNGVGRVDEDGGTERVRVDDDTTFRLTVRNNDGDEDTCSVTVRID